MPLSNALRLVAPLILSFFLVAPAAADNLSGAYLAARQADKSGDFRNVVEFGTRALVEDPENTELLEGLLVAHVGLGDFDNAVPVARRLLALKDEDHIAALVLLSETIKKEEWQSVLDALAKRDSTGELTDEMVTAWSHLGLGRMSQALEVFENIADDPGTKAFALYNEALARALAGDYEGAASILGGEGDTGLQLNREGVIAYVQVLSQLERNADALELIEKTFATAPNNDVLVLRNDLEAGKTVPFEIVTSAREGIASVFYTVATMLDGEVDDQIVLLYSRVAEYLDPGNSGSVVLSAEILESLERYELAVEAYAAIPPDDPAYAQAALGRAEALRRWGKADEAIGELRVLAQAYPDMPLVHVTLGDALRFEERYDEATKAYDAAIALYDNPMQRHWFVFFGRAITHEREGRWPQAEADFRKALELNPDEARVLNYLGYSFVEMGQNLDEALDMIERAVANRPRDGYIIDSLGWVYYRLGRYDDAVVQMERAVELMAVDPVVNDHLGDVYWAVGRQREAEFQWSRALSFITEDSNLEEIKPDRIRRKLEVGLEQVLKEEGSELPTRTDDG